MSILLLTSGSWAQAQSVLFGATITADGASATTSSTLDWTWVGGSNTGNAPGVYGTLGTPASANIPGARSYSASWTDTAGNFWLFGGLGNDAAGNYNTLNDLWKFNLSTSQWAWIGGSSTVPASPTGNGGQPGVYGTLGTPAAGNVPGSRRLASTWTDSAGHLWLYGGYGFDSKGNGGLLNDLWEFNPSTNQWAWMSGSNIVPVTTNANGGQPGIYGTLGTPAPTDVPGGRTGAMTWIDTSAISGFSGEPVSTPRQLPTATSTTCGSSIPPPANGRGSAEATPPITPESTAPSERPLQQTFPVPAMAQ